MRMQTYFSQHELHPDDRELQSGPRPTSQYSSSPRVASRQQGATFDQIPKLPQRHLASNDTNGNGVVSRGEFEVPSPSSICIAEKAPSRGAMSLTPLLLLRCMR